MTYRSFIKKINFDTLLINSDIKFGYNIKSPKKYLLKDHLAKLKDLTKESDVFFPAFNYSFLNNKKYDISLDKSEVGMLSEYYRCKISQWRSKVPVFSFTSKKKIFLPKMQIIDPFDQDSIFSYFYRNNSGMIHYGSSLRTTTIIHYVERIFRDLKYRYDKYFIGKIYDNKIFIEDIKLKYHVRPMGSNFDYDWINIENDLIDEGILNIYKNGRTRIMFFSIKDLVDYWFYKLNLNSLYFLDKTTLQWVEPKLELLGRAFDISDFE